MRHGAWRPCAAAVIVGRARPGSTGSRSDVAPVRSFEDHGLPPRLASGACTGQRTSAAGLYAMNERR
jgi:hypothetical protein